MLLKRVKNLKRILVNVIMMKNYKNIELYQDETTIKANGNFSLPNTIQKFDSPEEAKAFLQGVTWAVTYYDGEVKHYMKDMKV